MLRASTRFQNKLHQESSCYSVKSSFHAHLCKKARPSGRKHAFENENAQTQAFTQNVPNLACHSGPIHDHTFSSRPSTGSSTPTSCWRRSSASRPKSGRRRRKISSSTSTRSTRMISAATALQASTLRRRAPTLGSWDWGARPVRDLYLLIRASGTLPKSPGGFIRT